MSMDIHQLAKYFAEHPFQVEGVYRYAQNPGVPDANYTDFFPGFVFPLVGTTSLRLNNTPYILTPGKVIHGGAEMNLAQYTQDESEWEYILILYRIASSQVQHASYSQQHFELTIGQSPRLTALLMRLWQVYNEPQGISMLQTEMLFREVLNEVLLCAVNQQQCADTHSLFEQIRHYIHTNYYNNLTVTSITEQYNVNRNRLSYIFRKHAELGPADYILQHRLKIARQMLATSVISIQHIAEAVGITDPFYFSRIFKKHLGISPTKYREVFINNPCLDE